MTDAGDDSTLVDVLLAIGALSACPSEQTRAIGQRLYDARAKLYGFVELAINHADEFEDIVERQRERLVGGGRVMAIAPRRGGKP